MTSKPTWDVKKYGVFDMGEYSAGLLTEADLRLEQERLAQHQARLSRDDRFRLHKARAANDG